MDYDGTLARPGLAEVAEPDKRMHDHGDGWLEEGTKTK